jgi:LPS-assembly lipoprotein
MWSSDRRNFLRGFRILMLAPLLPGCGFQPMYGDGTPARGILGQVYVDVIPSAAGYVLRDRLIEELGPAETPTHTLEVELDIETKGVALTTQNFTTRFDVIGVASYRLRPVSGGPPVLTDQVRSIAGFSAPESQTASAFASRAAEEDAIRRISRQLADRIALRLALTAPEWSATASTARSP